MGTGEYKLIMEPITSSLTDGTVQFSFKAVPIPKEPHAQQLPTHPGTPDIQNEENSSDGDADGSGDDSETEPVHDTDGSSSKPKKRGIGSAHKYGNVKAYNLWMRLGVCEDIRKGDMSFKDAMKKWSAPQRRLSQWLKEYDAGAYSNLPSLYTQEELKKMYRLKGGGKKVADQALEDRLIKYYNELKAELYPITSELLAYECLAHDDKFLGGVNSPKFTSRISDFLRHWRRRNVKKLCTPTSTGQKLPEGYQGKWEATSYYFYLETKGVDPRYVYHGDETLLPTQDTPSKVYADAGAKFLSE